jgi:hypothetical protein
MKPAPLLPLPLLPPAAAGEPPLLPLLLLLSDMTTAGLTGGASPDSCCLSLVGRLTATAEAARRGHVTSHTPTARRQTFGCG